MYEDPAIFDASGYDARSLGYYDFPRTGNPFDLPNAIATNLNSTTPYAVIQKKNRSIAVLSLLDAREVDGALSFEVGLEAWPNSFETTILILSAGIPDAEVRKLLTKDEYDGTPDRVDREALAVVALAKQVPLTLILVDGSSAVGRSAEIKLEYLSSST